MKVDDDTSSQRKVDNSNAVTELCKSNYTDSLRVGDYEIRKSGDLIFIAHASGESGGFDPVLFEACIDKFFNANF